MDGHGETVIELILGALVPTVVVRVGPAPDASVRELAVYASQRGATVHVIDPDADPDAMNREPYGDAVVLHRAKCLNALARITDVDLLVIAGEHNWYTVTRALQFLEKQAAQTGHAFPLAVVTAVDWPYGRRDAYPDPDSVPDAFRHQFARGGLVPARSEPVEDGGLGAGIAHAIRERGPRNGVRSAIEDFIAQSELDLAFVDVPGMHGVAILSTADHRRRGRKIGRMLRRLRSEEFLLARCRQIEEARLEEMLTAEALRSQVAEQREQLEAQARRVEEIRSVRSQSAAAEQRVAELEKRLESRDRELEALGGRTEAALEERSRFEHELAARAEALKGLESERETLRQRLDALLTELNTQRDAAAEQQRARVNAEGRAAAAAREETRARADLLEASRLEEGVRRELILSERRALVKERELAARQTELEAARRRLQRLEADLVSAKSELHTNRIELEAARPALERLEAELAKASSDLDTGQTELDAARQHVEELERAAEHAEEQRRLLTEKVSTLERELEAGRAELQSARGELQSERAERRRLDGELERAAAEHADVEARLTAEVRRQGQLVSQMTLALADVKGDVERLAQSRAWRWGHWLARAARRLTFRKSITEGAAAAALQRLERIEEQRKALSAAGEAARVVEPPSGSRPGRTTEGPLAFCIKMGAPNWQAATSWGDLYFAEAVQRQLQRRGHGCVIQTLDEWDAREGHAADVVLHLKGTARYNTRPGQFNVLWCISHPSMVTGEECDGYDLVCVASERFASSLRLETRTPVLTIDQATDPEVFFPDRDPAYEHELVFVGNSRNVMRRILRDLLPTDRDLAIWGGQWEGLIDKRYVVGDRVPNGGLRKVYSSAAIVLNDHWDDMREHGFISNRIYDALACGAFIISDNVPELGERFGGAVKTYESPDDLRRLIDLYAGSPADRQEFGLRGRELVLGGHTFSHRVDDLLAAIRKQMPETVLTVR